MITVLMAAGTKSSQGLRMIVLRSMAPSAQDPTFWEILQGLPLHDVLPEGLNVKALIVVDGAKRVRHRYDFAALLLEDL